MSPIQQNLLWVALPYASLVLLVAGMIWRWRTDQFGWTSRSSQWNESRILRLASPLFHLGFLMVMGGHVVGLLVPKDVTEMLGVSQHMYHLGATYLGTFAAVMTILGRGLMTWPSRAARRACRATRPTELILATPPLASRMSTNSILSVIVSPQVFSSSNSTSVDNDRGCYRSCPQRDSSRAPHAPCRPHATAQWARFLTAPPPPPP